MGETKETTEQVSEGQLTELQNKEAEQQANKLMQLSETLFQYAMEDRWQEVVKLYEKNPHPECHGAKITEAEDTVLHLAVSGGKLEFVCTLVDILGKNDTLSVLKAKNKRGNTPLHIAAALGNARMCHYMVSKDHTLIALGNENQETPVYLAARFGHKDAFLCLCLCHSYEAKRSEICSRNASGNTILHAAIEGEHFDLAFQIVRKYPELVNTVNENGLSPLHILATKTNAFKTGSRLGFLDKIIYRCVMVDEVKEEFIDDSMNDREMSEEKGPFLPQNYDTCVDLFRLFWGVVFYGMPSFSSKHDMNKDEENPKTAHVADHQEGTGQKPEDNNNNKKERKFSRKDHLPANYATFTQFFKFVTKLVLIVLGHGFQRIRRITNKKQRHTWATQVMNELIENASTYKYFGGQPGGEMNQDFPRNFSQMSSSSGDGESSSTETLGTHETESKGHAAMVEKFLSEYKITGTVASKALKHAVKMEFEKKVVESSKPNTPILIAASNGITEMVKKILEKFPVAIQDVDAENKNVILLAVENRQTHTFQFLMERQIMHESFFRQADNQGNNALHLAATYGHYRPWQIPGSALQMQWELKWYQFVKKSLAKHLLVHYNKKGQTPKQIFTETHKALVKDGSEWLNKTSESCSLIAALIATVAFATAANIPGGVDDKTGKPVLRNEPAFRVFAISSLIALCFSLTALVFFLAILTSRFEEKDFAVKLPRKLILGLTSLFTSIAAILVSFCAGHFFELRDELKFAEIFPIYTVTCLPISFFALAQLPLYFDLLWAICKRVPQRGYREFAS